MCWFLNLRYFHIFFLLKLILTNLYIFFLLNPNKNYCKFECYIHNLIYIHTRKSLLLQSRILPSWGTETKGEDNLPSQSWQHKLWHRSWKSRDIHRISISFYKRRKKLRKLGAVHILYEPKMGGPDPASLPFQPKIWNLPTPPPPLVRKIRNWLTPLPPLSEIIFCRTQNN